MTASPVEGVRGADGLTRWRDAEGRFHRDGGPAVITDSGDLRWYRHGKRHRTDGPAVTYHVGSLGRMWIVNDVHIREDVDVLDALYDANDTATLTHVLSIWTPEGPGPAALLDAVRAACA